MQSDCQLVAFCAQPDCILTSSWLKPDCCLDAFWMKIVAEHRTLSRCAASQLARTDHGCAQPAARLGALGNQRRSRWATAPSTCSENMPCGGGVDRVVQAAEMRASGFELLDDLKEMAD
jgi:hypothetical protein